MERYVVIVGEGDEQFLYGTFKDPDKADDWIAEEQKRNGAVNTEKAVVVILNLP